MDPVNFCAQWLYVSRTSYFTAAVAFFTETSELGTCEKHGSGKLEVRKCTCMLSAGEQLEYDEHVKIASDHMQNGNELDAVMAYMEALKIADHDLEIRQRLCSVGLRYCNDEYCVDSPQ